MLPVADRSSSFASGEFPAWPPPSCPVILGGVHALDHHRLAAQSWFRRGLRDCVPYCLPTQLPIGFVALHCLPPPPSSVRCTVPSMTSRDDHCRRTPAERATCSLSGVPACPRLSRLQHVSYSLQSICCNEKSSYPRPELPLAVVAGLFREKKGPAANGFSARGNQPVALFAFFMMCNTEPYSEPSSAASVSWTMSSRWPSLLVHLPSSS